MLVEKPISIKGIREVQALSDRLQQLQAARHLVISVGYQMRYLPAAEVCAFGCACTLTCFRASKCIG